MQHFINSCNMQIFNKLFSNKQLTLLVCMSLVITFLLYVRDIVGISVPRYSFLAFILIIAIQQKVDYIVSTIAFLLPLTCGIPNNILLFSLMVILIYKCNSENTFKSKSMVNLTVILCLWEFFHLILNPSGNIDIIPYLGYIASLFFLLVIPSFPLSARINWSRALLFFCFGTCVLLLFIRLNFENVLGADFYEEGMRLGSVEQYTGQDDVIMLRTNANNIGLYSATAISIALCLYYYKKINVFILGLLFAISYSSGILSISRTWAICIGITVIWFLIVQKENRIRNMVILSLIVIVGFYYVSVVNPTILDAFTARFNEDDVNSGAGRSEIISEYNNYLVEHPFRLLFGSGAISYGDVITEIKHSVHNGTQQIIVSYGLMGFLCFIIPFCSFLKKRYVKGQTMALLPLICTGIFLQTLQFLNPSFDMYPFMASMFVINMVNSKFEYTRK